MKPFDIPIEEVEEQTIEPIDPKHILNVPQPSLTAPSSNVVDTSYGANEATVIENLRNRVNEMEDRLIKIGFIQGTYNP